MGGGSSIPAKYRRTSVSETIQGLEELVNKIKPSLDSNPSNFKNDLSREEMENIRDAVVQFQGSGHWNCLSMSKLKLASHLATSRKKAVAELSDLFIEEIMSVVESWKSEIENMPSEDRNGTLVTAEHPQHRLGQSSHGSSVGSHVYVAACISNRFVKKSSIFAGREQCSSNDDFTVISSTLGKLRLGVIPFQNALMTRSASELEFKVTEGNLDFSTTEKFENEGLKLSSLLLQECDKESLPPCDLEPVFETFKLHEGNGLPKSGVHALCFPWLQDQSNTELLGTIILYRVLKEDESNVSKDGEADDVTLVKDESKSYTVAFPFLEGDKRALLRAYLMDVGTLLHKEINITSQTLDSQFSRRVLQSVLRVAKQLYHHKSDPLEAKIAMLLELIERDIPCERITIMIRDPEHDELWCVSREVVNKSKWKRLRSLIRDSCITKFWVPYHACLLEGQVIETGNSVNVLDLQKCNEFNLNFFESKYGTRLRSLISVPILHDKQKKVIGVMQFFNRIGDRKWFTTHDEALSHAIAEELGAAISVASLEALYRTERHGRENLNSVVDGAQVASLLAMYQHTKGSNKKDVSVSSSQQTRLIDRLRNDLKDQNEFQTVHESIEHVGKLDDKIPDLVDWNLACFEKSTSELIDYTIHIFSTFGIVDKFEVSPGKLRAFLQNISEGYDERNPYHNFTHGFQVTHSTFMMLTTTSANQILKLSEMLGVLVAAVGHDVGHPGTNNAFQVAVKSPLALTYNDKSVLENFHASKTFQIMNDEDCSILENLSADHYSQIRDVIIHCILATDISSHYKLMNSVNERIAFGNVDDSKLGMEDRRMSFYEEQTDLACILRRNRKGDRQLLSRMLLHCADLNNAALPFFLAKEWTNLVVKEFKQQYEKELELGLPPTEFMKVDPSDIRGVAALQVNFIDFVAAPLWQAMGKLFPSLDERVNEVNDNRSVWKKVMLAKNNDDAFEVANDYTNSTRMRWQGKRNSVLITERVKSARSSRSQGTQYGDLTEDEVVL